MIGIWDASTNGTLISKDGGMTNPIVFKVPPQGGVQEKKFYLRHAVLSGEQAESSYSVTVAPNDTFGTDESSYVKVAPDVAGVPGVYASSLSVGDVLAGNIVAFWVKADVPTNSYTGAKEDITLKVSSSSTEQFMTVPLKDGTHFKTSYSIADNSVDFAVTNTYGEWKSKWIDVSLVDTFTYAQHSVVGSHIRFYYRTSTDASEETASAYYGDIADTDPTANYLQVKAEFQTNSRVGQTGLVQQIYGNDDFSVFKAEFVGGKMPFSTTPGESFPAPKSVRWSGFLKIDTAGTYKIRTTSRDGHRIYIDEQMIADQWTTGATASSTTSIYLSAGWHTCKWEYKHVGGTNDIKTYITPPSQVERNVALSDFTTTEQTLKINKLELRYSGNKDQYYDVRIYDGPDVPELLSPDNGYQTELFAPELSAVSKNSDYIEFQIDNETTFATTYLEQWVVPVERDVPVFTNPPTGSRPDGVYYWRARGVYNGVVSEWSDYRLLTILPLATNPEYLYLNVNNGLQVHDPIIDNRYTYLHVNNGFEDHDPIVDPRMLYLNVNVEVATGKVIYPLQDDTRTRKIDFDGDDTEFSGGI